MYRKFITLSIFVLSFTLAGYSFAMNGGGGGGGGGGHSMGSGSHAQMNNMQDQNQIRMHWNSSSGGQVMHQENIDNNTPSARGNMTNKQGRQEMKSDQMEPSQQDHVNMPDME